jgi:hypothetical protein
VTKFKTLSLKLPEEKHDNFSVMIVDASAKT